jgi:hypothetical protein
MKTLTIASRFCGPAASSNGGYFAGLVATLASRTLAVRLLKPPPLDTELAVRDLQDGTLQVMHAQEAIGEARPAVLTLDAKPPPDYLEAVEASRRYAGFRYHRFPTCFVCGTRRVRGDGLRIFAGPIAELGVVAEFTAHVDRLVHIGESCTLVGWQIGSSGRKHEAGTAIFDGKGELCGKARALWIEPRTAGGSGA